MSESSLPFRKPPLDTSRDLLSKPETSSLPPEAQELLKRPSHGQRNLRTSVDFSEIEQVLSRFEFNTSPQDLYHLAGLGSRAYKEDKERNWAKKTTKYALLGLLLEENQKAQYEFSFHELAIIFSALLHHRRTRDEPFQQEVKDVQKVVIKLMLEKEI